MGCQQLPWRTQTQGPREGAGAKPLPALYNLPRCPGARCWGCQGPGCQVLLLRLMGHSPVPSRRAPLLPASPRRFCRDLWGFVLFFLPVMADFVHYPGK